MAAVEGETPGAEAERPHEGSIALVVLFALALAYGVFAFVWLFFVERPSEATLLRRAHGWILPVCFGAYGLIAERLYRVRWKLDVKMLVIASIVMFGLPVPLLLPLALLRLGSVAVALAGALLWWLAMLPLFLEVVWPMM